MTGRHTQCYTEEPIFHVNMLMGWSRYGESGRQKSMDWCMYTLYPRCGTTSRVTGTCTQWYTEAPIFPCKYANGVKQTWGVRQRKVHILMHVHILTKVCEQKWDDCKTHIATQWHPCLHVTMHKGWSRIQNRLAYVHVLMHVHILNKVWEQK